MATAATIQIPKTTSRPCNPNEASFIETLPAELRNRIYEVLFNRDQPVRFHNGRADRDRNDREGSAQSIDVDQRVQGDGSQHGFGNVIALLLSCRQIYHEAAGILYGRNTFLFSPPLNANEYPTKDHIDLAITWIASIGSQFSFLSQVQIVPEQLGYTPPDLLPLLKVIWAHPNAKCEIKFAETGQVVLYPTRLQHRNCNFGLVIVLNNLIVTLGRRDALNIKQYGKYRGIISSVQFKWDPNYAGTCMFAGGTTRYFDTIDDGKTVKWSDPPQGSPLLWLPGRAKRLIHTYACLSKAGVVFDLDSKAVSGLEEGLRGVSQQLHEEAHWYASWRQNDFTIQMATQEAATSFNNFAAFRQFANIPFYEDIRTPRFPTDIVLKFDLSTSRTLGDLRIDFGRLLSSPPLKRECLDHCVVALSGPITSPPEKARFAWSHVQRSTFYLLSEVLEQLPSKAHQPPPQIWMDGHGTVLQATYSATATSDEVSILSLDENLNEPSVFEQVRRRFRSVRLSLGPRLEYFDPNDSDTVDNPDPLPSISLLDIWVELKNTLLKDC
ncbi:hypothetical protein BDW02DRAFT_169257 [Decorospora gaudefroyi]|uniref:DUF7730 domain-containing protein n=1 Tax=Decorospora gaudefroyi TaxID=184978 RepID=A0A6A5K7P6_9PLEO|nr:hypothetical protein BDW02DRAFT_169257 [Decorospora gaudefroyi]